MKVVSAYGYLGRIWTSYPTSRLVSRMLKSGFAVCLLFCFSGCATIGTKAMIDDLRSKKEEFVHAGQNDMLKEPFRGSFIGTVQQDGITYNGYQFTNLLAGASTRVLEIRIPHVPSSGRGVLLETDLIMPALAPAHLLAACMPSSSLSPEGYFQQCYPQLDLADYATHTIQSSYIISYTPYHVRVINRHEDTGELEWIEYYVDIHIRWVKRSRAAYALSHLAFLVAVPIDIVTSPVQLVLGIWISSSLRL